MSEEIDRVQRSLRQATAAVARIALLIALSGGLETEAKPRASDAAPLEIGGLSARVAAETVVLRLALSEEAVFSLFTLTAPRRLVIDLPAFDWAAETPESLGQGAITAVRHGLFRHDRGRVVFDLSRPLAVRRAGIRDTAAGPALEITLVPSSAAAFAERAGWPEGSRWAPEAGRPRLDGEGPVVIAIDPGHGGVDPGAVFGRLYEKDLVLEFAHRLGERLATLPGYSVFLTRRDDRFLPLGARIDLARAAGAHIFLSLHADSLATGDADGASVYTLSREGTDDATAAFAARENRADVLAGVNLAGSEDDVTRLLIELARRGSGAESVKLAEDLVGAMRQRVDVLDTRPHRRGNFYVLKAPDLPSVLIELGFLSSEIDRERLRDPDWQAAMVEAIAAGIIGWTGRASRGFLAPRG